MQNPERMDSVGAPDANRPVIGSAGKIMALWTSSHIPDGQAMAPAPAATPGQVLSCGIIVVVTSPHI